MNRIGPRQIVAPEAELSNCQKASNENPNLQQPKIIGMEHALYAFRTLPAAGKRRPRGMMISPGIWKSRSSFPRLTMRIASHANANRPNRPIEFLPKLHAL